MTRRSAKVCLLGQYYVGKTSLVRQFVTQQFDERYQSTLGVKIDTKTLNCDQGELKLVMWDIQGADDTGLRHNRYLNGSEGFLLVVDITRPETLKTAGLIQESIQAGFPNKPIVLLLNKIDLDNQWSLDTEALQLLEKKMLATFKTSAKTGECVENAFQQLGAAILSS